MGVALARRQAQLRTVNAFPPTAVRRASEEQSASGYALVREYFANARVVARETEEEFRREYFGEQAGLWLAWQAGQLAGCVALRALGEPGKAEIKRMYVREPFRGRGVAQSLLEAVEAFARDRGYEWLYLDTTDVMVAAARLYRRHGYEPCNRYNSNPQATIFMRKRLRAGPPPDRPSGV
jgi:GNAT superfamily N-acetyltransferase